MNKGGAPTGNTNGQVRGDGRRALELALENYGSDEPLAVIGRIKTLVLMWQPILRKAIEDGDLAAMKEINDRLDGKAAQSITQEVTIKETDPAKRKSRIQELLSKTKT
tara:strand:- start:404 stop:727 length:324 start_codon:yes stop_codon:yes gene_type:complete